MVTAMNILTPPTSFIFENQTANSQKQEKKKSSPKWIKLQNNAKEHHQANTFTVVIGKR